MKGGGRLFGIRPLSSIPPPPYLLHRFLGVAGSAEALQRARIIEALLPSDPVPKAVIDHRGLLDKALLEAALAEWEACEVLRSQTSPL